MEKTKVLIIDDSATVRSSLENYLNKIDDIEVVGTAPDPFIGRDKIVKLKPDVITLDIEMPRMDGLTFLEKLMKFKPMPVIIVSSITTTDKFASIKALEIGAFDIVNKQAGQMSINEVLSDIEKKIRMAGKVKDQYIIRQNVTKNILVNSQPKTIEKSVLDKIETTDKIIAIGASTGGTTAIEFILKNLPHNTPPIIIIQHMPIGFTAQFAKRLDEISKIHVVEATNDEILKDSTAYIAQGGFHLELYRKGISIYTKLISTPKVHYQRPAVDVTFKSLAAISGKNVIAYLLTGMGRDGAEGLLSLKNKGAMTIAQDEKSSIVWGMPKAAIDMKANNSIISLEKIPLDIINRLK